ncbi:DUF2953 domain-containing protein [Bacillus aerolatus]|nr:DUF2953 domain-containing protein [Bacillus aerolatus]
MEFLWWGLAILAGLMLIVCLLKLQILFYFLRVPGHTEAHVRFHLFRGLLTYTFHIPLKKLAEEGEEKVEKEVEQLAAQVKAKLKQAARLHAVIRSFLNKVEVRGLRWQTAVGMRDAAWTATAAGSLWALKGNAVSAVSRMVNMTARPELAVTPVFGQSIWKMECSCMISFRIGHAIAAVIQLFFRRRSNNKRVEDGPAFQKNV